MYTGPHLTKKDLAFGYDTGYGVADNSTATRFYPGEATTNFVTTNLETLSPDGSGQSSVGTRTTIAPNHVRIVDVASNTRQSHLISGLTASTIYTVSIQFKKITGTPTFRFQLQGYSGSSYVNTIKFTSTAETGLEDIEGWQTAEWTFTLPSNCNALRIWWQDGADYTTYTHSFELKNPQLEAKSHVTPYVSGTRSSTASLIDLTETTDINVSNVSFDSTGQPTFDGTDDRIDSVTGVGIADYSQPFTMECIFMVPTGATWANERNSNIFSIAGSYAGHYGFYKYGTTGVGFQIRSATTGTYPATTGLLRDTYYHITAVFQGGSGLTLYRNGVPVSTSSSSFTGAPDSPNLYIGGVRSFGGSAGTWFQGEIPVAKYYNRALTAQEVQGNYNAYKNRFDL